MNHSEIEAAVRGVVAAVLRQELGDGAASRQTLPAWDSLKHIEILFAVEDRLDVRFDEAELPALESIDAIVAAVELHRAA